MNLAVSSVIFQGWAIHANVSISLGMSTEIGYARGGTSRGTWISIFHDGKNCCKVEHFQVFFSLYGGISWETRL